MHKVWNSQNIPSFQATMLHPGKAKNYEPKALNKTMLPIRKSLTTSDTKHRTPPILTHISINEKEWGREGKKEPHKKCFKDGKKRKVKKNKLVKLN